MSYTITINSGGGGNELRRYDGHSDFVAAPSSSPGSNGGGLQRQGNMMLADAPTFKVALCLPALSRHGWYKLAVALSVVGAILALGFYSSCVGDTCGVGVFLGLGLTAACLLAFSMYTCGAAAAYNSAKDARKKRTAHLHEDTVVETNKGGGNSAVRGGGAAPAKAKRSNNVNGSKAKRSSARPAKAAPKPLRSVTVGEKLGSGEGGEVFKGKYQGGDVALKLFDTKEEFETESMLAMSLSHPNTVRCFGTYEAKGRQYLVMELLSGGSVYDLMTGVDAPVVSGNKEEVRAKRKMLYKMARDAAVGVAFLHANRVVHCDLAARNIMVEKKADGYRCVVADFGLSQEVQEGSESVYGGNKVPVRWSAPEVLKSNGGKQNGYSDTFSFGVFLYELFTNCKTPYSGMSNAEVTKLVLRGGRLDLSVAADGCEKIPKNARELIKKCWKHKPTERPTMYEVVKHLDEVLAGTSGVNDTTYETDDMEGNYDVYQQSSGGSGEGGYVCLMSVVFDKKNWQPVR